MANHVLLGDGSSRVLLGDATSDLLLGGSNAGYVLLGDGSSRVLLGDGVSAVLLSGGAPASAAPPSTIGLVLTETNPLAVVLERPTQDPINLAPLIAAGTLKWSSVVPGGFASFSATLEGDPRQLSKLVPYLSIVRIIGSSGRTLFEGQIEDKNISITATDVGLAIAAFGLQNAAKETALRRIWSKRDMQWDLVTVLAGMKGFGGSALALRNDAWAVNTGQYDPTNASRTGVQVIGTNAGGSALVASQAAAAEFDMPLGLSAKKILGTAKVRSTNGYVGAIWGSTLASPSFDNALVTFSGSTTTDFSQSVSGDAQIRLGVYVSAGGGATIDTGDGVDFYNLRVLGTTTDEDVDGGFYGDTLIRDIVAQVPALEAGVIESGSDFTVDHLDAGVRRGAADILNEVAQYYSREWAVWEDAKLSWETPNLSQHQWIIPITQFAELNLDASVVNSQKRAVVIYTDAASQLDAEQETSSTDRRNPYVLNGREKDLIVQGGTMTANTALQLSSVLLNDLGFGPVPASGTVVLLGETLVQHAQGNAVKAWEIRAGDNVTIPELPEADVFTQDGRGEVLFHVISCEADGETGLVTLELDSYGSKRSDVLLARLAAVTSLLGG